MDEYIEEKTTYTIDNQEYPVIARCKKDNNIERKSIFQNRVSSVEKTCEICYHDLENKTFLQIKCTNKMA